MVGSYLLKVFLENGHKVYVMARPSAKKTAQDRILGLLHFWGHASAENPVIIESDICDAGLTLEDEVDEIYHCAAITNLNWQLEDIREINVGGTRNILDLAGSSFRKGKLIKVNHISTAYIYGDYTGRFDENSLDAGQKFKSTYEQTKFEAEKLIAEYRKKGLWIDVFRPSIVIGHSVTGKTFQFKNIYQILKLCSLGIFDSIPLKDGHVSLVPIDLAAGAIYAISSNSKEQNRNYHIFPRKLVRVEEIVELGSRLLGFKAPALVSREDFDLSICTPAQKAILQGSILAINWETGLNSDYTNNILSGFGFNLPDINSGMLSKSLEYFIKESYALRAVL